MSSIHRPLSLAARQQYAKALCAVKPFSPNWAYAIADVFRDLDSTDRATQAWAFAKVSAFGVGTGVVGALAWAGATFVAGAATAGAAGSGATAAIEAGLAGPGALATKVYVIGESGIARVVPFANAIGASTMPSISGSSAFKDAATREVIDAAMELDMIIINIGRDPTKVANGLRIGAYYLAALEQIAERGYTRVIDWK